MGVGKVGVDQMGVGQMVPNQRHDLIEILENVAVYDFASGKLATSHIASATIQLCAVAIKSFLH